MTSPRLLAVSVGLPRDHDWRGRVVHVLTGDNRVLAGAADLVAFINERLETVEKNATDESQPF